VIVRFIHVDRAAPEILGVRLLPTIGSRKLTIALSAAMKDPNRCAA
jgi:hypothetical protein